jgi:hypothetical protein
VTIPTQPEPSDATRFATRPKRRKREERNVTDNKLEKLRRETVGKALGALVAGHEDLRFADRARGVARRELEEGMWRLWVEDDRSLDAETVAEQFARAEREYSAAIHNRAVIRQYGVTA